MSDTNLSFFLFSRRTSLLATLFLSLMSLAPMMARSQDPRIELIITEPYNDQKSFPLWEAQQRSQSNAAPALFLLSRIIYSNTDDLILKVSAKIAALPSTNFGVFVGVATTDEAMALSKMFSGGAIKRTNFSFLSPLVTGDEKGFTALPFLPGALSDEKRIEKLADQRPEFWKTLDSQSIITGDSFGEQLNDLLRAHTNLYKSFEANTVTNAAAITRIADNCCHSRTPLIFAALETGPLRAFLKRLRSDAEPSHPYKPIICLLQEYGFSTNASRIDTIPDHFR